MRFWHSPCRSSSLRTPVIAFNAGGLKETVREGVTGVFFNEQSIESIRDAIIRFEQKTFDAVKIREHAMKFGKQRFEKEMKDFINTKYQEFLAKKI